MRRETLFSIIFKLWGGLLRFPLHRPQGPHREPRCGGERQDVISIFLTKPSPRKLKKAEMMPTFEMEPTQDILAEMGKCRSEGQTIVGFAAETNDCEANGLEKLRSKNLDWIVVNDVGADGRGFGSGENEVTLLGADGSTVHFGPAAKLEVARKILEVVRT